MRTCLKVVFIDMMNDAHVVMSVDDGWSVGGNLLIIFNPSNENILPSNEASLFGS